MNGASIEEFGEASGPCIVVHGGAGARSAPREPVREAAMQAGLLAALGAGRRALGDGAGALDAVCAAVRALEDAPEFNAGRGAALTSTGGVELDACVADGASGCSGAVTGLADARHPVDAARAVMECTPHVFFAHPAADLLDAWGIEREAPEYFVTERSRARLAEYEAGARDAGARHGTVGAVCRDAAGHLAAATSTGGITGQLPGRVGDSPVFGAGTFAADATVAVSCTGTGETFIETVAAYRVHALVELGAATTPDAAARVLDEVAGRGGSGGLIVVPRRGRAVVGRNSAAMAYGIADGAGVRVHV